MTTYRSRALMKAMAFTGTPENIFAISEMLDGNGSVSETSIQIFEDGEINVTGPVGSLLVLDQDGAFDLYRPEEISVFHADFEEVA